VAGSCKYGNSDNLLAVWVVLVYGEGSCSTELADAYFALSDCANGGTLLEKNFFLLQQVTSTLFMKQSSISRTL
jgi:hypothetical protein